MFRRLASTTIVAIAFVTLAVAADNPAENKLNRDVARHKEFLKRIEKSKGEGDVIFLGDSITHGWEGKKAWKEHYGEFKPVNLGIGGDQTGHVLWRITDGKELENLNPKAAVIMIGTNNTGGHSAEQIAGGIKAIVDARLPANIGRIAELVRRIRGDQRRCSVLVRTVRVVSRAESGRAQSAPTRRRRPARRGAAPRRGGVGRAR